MSVLHHNCIGVVLPDFTDNDQTNHHHQILIQMFLNLDWWTDGAQKHNVQTTFDGDKSQTVVALAKNNVFFLEQQADLNYSVNVRHFSQKFSHTVTKLCFHKHSWKSIYRR